MKRLLLIVLVLMGSAAFAQNYNSLNGPFGGGPNKIITVGSGRLLAFKVYVGVYRSDDNGANWTKSSTGLQTPYIRDIFMDASGKVYALFDDSIFISNDNGSTWTVLANTGFEGGMKLAQGPSGNLFIAASNSVYRSTNGGVTWSQRIQLSEDYAGISDFEFTSAGRMLIGTYNRGFFTTNAETDLSATQITVTQGLPGNQVSSVIQSGSNLYVLTDNGPAKSTNGGSSFTLMLNSPLPAANCYCFYGAKMEKDPSGILYLVFGNTIYKSTDGSTWSSATITGPAPNFGPVSNNFYIANATTFYLSEEGVGVFKTTNTGTSWTLVDNGMLMHDFNQIMITSNGRLLVSKNNGHGIYISTDDGASWEFQGTGNLARRIDFFKKVGTTIYAWGQGIIKSTDNGSSWSVVHSGGSTPNLNSFNGLLTNDGTTMYTFDTYDQATGSANFGMWKSTNGGSTFARTTITGLPSTDNTSFANDHSAIMDASGNIYLTLYDYNTRSDLFYKIASGTSAATKITNTGLTQGIDEAQVVNNKLYVAGYTGTGYKLMVSSDGGGTWTAKNMVSSYYRIKILDDDNYLAYSTSISLTTDGGTNWTNTGVLATGAVVDDISVSAANYSYAISDYNGVYKSKNLVVPPTAPTGLVKLANSHNNVSLEWTDNSTTETYFRVEASENDNLHYDSVVYAVRENSFAQPTMTAVAFGLKPGSKYFFRVKAVGPGGVSNGSNEVSLTLPADCTATSDIPTNRSWTVSSLNTSGTNLSPSLNQYIIPNGAIPGNLLAWNIGLGLAGSFANHPTEPLGGYLVNNCGSIFLVSDTYGGAYVQTGPATWNSTTKKITIPIKTHPRFQLISETIVFTLNATDPAPVAPTSLTAGVYTSGSILISWVSTRFTTKYEIERSTANNAGYAKIGEVGPDVVVYKDSDPALTPGTKYYYRVRGVNATGNSPYSNEVNITPTTSYTFDRIDNLLSKMYFTSVAGGSWGDIDNDGIEDLVIGGAQDSLLQNLPLMIFKGYGNGKFTRIRIPELDAEATGDCRNVNIVDINNDGLNDIFYASANFRSYVAIQNADHSWTKTFANFNGSGGVPTSSWADIDNDGDLDLVYGGDNYYSTGAPGDVKVFKNNGTGVLTVDTQNEITTNSIAFNTRDIAMADFDNDGWIDALKMSTTNYSTLYRNVQGNLKAVIGSTFESTQSNSRTASWGDYDNDGDLDVFVGAASGNVNTLFKNNGNGTFSEVGGSALSETLSTFGSTWADIDNDMDLDFIATGSGAGANRIYFNNGNGTFTKSTKDELFTNPNLGKLYGISMADVDNDGFLDFFVGGFNAQGVPNFVYKNQNTPSSSRNWLKVKLQGKASNRSAIGVRLKMVVGGKTLMRYVQSHTSHASQSSLIQHFGIGSATSITSLTLYWPSGQVQTISPINTVNTTITIIEDGLAPAVTALFPANASTTGGVTKLEMTFDDPNPIPVAGKKINVYNTATPASPLYTLDISAGVKSGSKFTFALPAKLPIGQSFQVTVDAGAYIDEFNNQSKALTTADWAFIIGEDPDMERPKITFDPNSLSVLEQGFTPKTINISVTDDKGVTGVTFFHRKAAKGAFESASLGANPTTFDVANTMTDEMGMEYYFEASDAIGKSRAPADENTYYRAVIQYTGTNRPTVRVPGDGTATSWKLISIPYDLPTTQVSQIFADLGSPAKNSWRLIRYSFTDKDVWLEYPSSINTIDRGKGYFINATTSKDITITDPKAPVYSQGNLFKMNLVKGWNQIGNPYNVTINWNDVRAYNGITAKVKELFLYNVGQYTANPEMLKETGGFVYATEDVPNVVISFPGQTASGGRIGNLNFGPIDSDAWMINMSASNSEWRSPIGGIGMTPVSSTSYDEFDQFSPPRFLNYLEFNFDHPEYSYHRFGRDVVTTSDEYVWEFNVETNLTGLTTLSWDKPSVVDQEVQLYLYDVAQQRPVDMIAETSYTIDPSNSGRFKVYYGRNVWSKIKPNRVALGAAIPNPVNSSTSISFTVPEKDGKMNVRLEVFDLTGRKVSTIANGAFEPGFYSAEWHPNEATPNGMYVYRLSAGTEVLGGKMILKK